MLSMPASLSGARRVRGGCRVAATMADAGGRAHVAALVKRLAPGRSAAEQAEAAHVLARLCSDKSRNKGYVRECGGVVALVALLAPGSAPAAQEQAAAALGYLCHKNTRNQGSLRECGGIAALVALLAPGSSPAVQERAAGALTEVCADSARTGTA